jgi:hypothetical protein
MKPNITKEDVIALREEFIKYTETAEQHEFPKLAFINLKLDYTIKAFERISDNDKEKNTMFRIVYRVIGKDFSEYEIE